MDIEITSQLSGERLSLWRELINAAGLVAEECAERTVLMLEGGELVATGARDGSVLKLIAVSDSHRGEDLTARVLTELRRDAFADGYQHLFLYTKPENRYTFESLFFYPVVESESVLVMENRRSGISDFLAALPEAPPPGKIGAAVMNCDPFTLGHRSLIERAAAECDRVFVFVLSEDRGCFSAEDRFNMVLRGVAHLSNVTVLKTGPYLISSATFPTYFIKDRDRAGMAACGIDIEIFVKHLAKRLGITHRYVGTEPISRLTAEYNAALKARLPEAGIEVVEVERVRADGAPISASLVRELIAKRELDLLPHLLPDTTLGYLAENNYI